MRYEVVAAAILFPLFALSSLAQPTSHDSPSGNAVIRAKAGSSEIVITTTDRLAGAIHSLTWNKKEFIDSFDHGRQLQSACSFDCGKSKDFWAECYNPTEAGARKDGRGERSTSKLLRLRAEGAELQTTTQMAFWLAPGEESYKRPALNDKLLSDHRLEKHVRIGYKELPHAIEYKVIFTLPKNERHTIAQYEALTGYMPAEFSRFYKWLPVTKEMKDLDYGPGEQAYPVVLATPDGSHAMGIYSPDPPLPGCEKASYGRWRFKEEKVVKWNCVFRIRNKDGVPSGEHPFRLFVAVGTLEDVRNTLTALAREFRK